MCHRENQYNGITAVVNKESVVLKEGTTIAELLEARGARSRSAVWVNGTQLLLAEYPTFVIRQGDEIKILRVIAGG